MDLEGMKADKGCDEVGDHFELVTRIDYASSDSSFDFCENFSDVERNFSDGYTKVKEESEGSSSDFDLCEEFDAHSNERSPGSSEDEYSGAVSESESNCANNNDSTDCVRRLRAKEFYKKYTETMMLTAGITQMSDSEFKEMQLREIVKEHALPFLPAKSLVRFRTVSKVWDRWIMNPYLAHKQSYNFRDMSGYFYEQYNGDLCFLSLCTSAYGIPDLGLLTRASLLSSSNGLLLYLKSQEDITYYVCNPSTKRCKQLPQPSCYHGEDPAVVLAFEPSVLNIEAHYQVVCAFRILDEPVICFEIYSSETNTWTSVDVLCTGLGCVTLENNGFYLNGVAYWETMSHEEVLAFDIKSEIYDVLPLPPDMPTGGTLGQINGELCYVSASKLHGSVFEVSFYRGIGSMSLKRTSYFDLGTDSYYHSCRLLPSFCNDTVTILVDGCMYHCHLHDGKVQMVNSYVALDLDGKYLPYVNSLVSVA